MAPAKPTSREIVYLVTLRAHPPNDLAQRVSRAHAEALQSKRGKGRPSRIRADQKLAIGDPGGREVPH